MPKKAPAHIQKMQPAQGQRCPHPDDVAHPHRAAQRGADSGKGGDAARFALLQQRADRPFQDGRQTGQRQKAGPHRKVKPAQQCQQDGPPPPEQLGKPFDQLFHPASLPHFLL